ncbi:unnamed protein product [Prorocentrum cordatum]|uniref:CFAP65 seventh Ig-like domain-containing protein n=1 Tax=Prorocentrum cordatum TaxID=2364126 RepID=A0ABN9S0Y9_9DINO|nr:unnamed protein product [Polarella glacialis]
MVLVDNDHGDRQLHSGVKEVLNFGSLQVQEARSFTLLLSSPTFSREGASGARRHDEAAGDAPAVKYDFFWQMRTAAGALIEHPAPGKPPFVTISPVRGVATHDNQTEITVEYAPPESHKLDGTLLRMVLPAGGLESSYTFELQGQSKRPAVDFSFTSHDFGPCFVQRSGDVTTLEPASPTNSKAAAERKELIVTNQDVVDCWLSTTFVRTPWLDVEVHASMIEAGKSLVVPIVFTPRHDVEYHERIEFVINDCTKTYVNIHGRGCEMSVELLSMAMQTVDFGTTVGNTSVTRTVRVVNRSPRPVEFSLHDPNGQLTERCLSWVPTEIISLKPKEQAQVELTFRPNFHITPFKLPLRYQPTVGPAQHLLNVAGRCHASEVRLSEHSILFGDVVFDSASTRKMQLQNFGDLGVHFRWELPAKVAALFSVEPKEGFAAPYSSVEVTVGFRPKRHEALPVSGSAQDDRDPAKKAAGAERDLARPKKIRCVLESEHEQEPLELVLQGHGVDSQESARKALQFSTEVRERHTLKVLIPPDGKNPTGDTWKLNPVVKTLVPTEVDYWFCPSEVVVPPNGQAEVEISYRPLTMTAPKSDSPVPQPPPQQPGAAKKEALDTKGSKSAVPKGPEPAPPSTEEAAATDGEADEEKKEKAAKPKTRPKPAVRRKDAGADNKSFNKPPRPEVHTGNIFVPTPDGSAFVFNLEGISLPPKEQKRIASEAPCKTSYVQSVPLTNWLQESQRFNVSLSLLEPAGTGEDIKLQGGETFDLPPGRAKDYKFNVYAYREGTAIVGVVFTNPRTDEYVQMQVAFKFVAPRVLDTLTYNVACRQITTKSIAVVNPLSTATTFKCQASHPELRLSPSEFSVLPGAGASVDVIFRPLLPGSGEATVHLRSEHLGVYPYSVKYDVQPAGLNKTIVFKAPLGLSVTQSFKFMYYSRKAAAYSTSIDAAPGHQTATGNFALASAKDLKGSLPAASEDGTEASIDVRFQPSSLGEVRALLVVSSAEAGDYKALLVGYTQPPQPQGPVTIVNGKSGSVEFMNPFDEAVEFAIQVDNPAFSVGSRAVKLDPKKSSNVNVQLKCESPQSGRLLITAQKCSTPWVFLLSGVMA